MSYKLKPLKIKQPKRRLLPSSIVHNTTVIEPLKIVDIAQEQNGNTIKYCFLYEDGSSSPEMQVEVPEGPAGRDGQDGDEGKPGQQGPEGRQGRDGKDGKSGRDGREIAEIAAYARQWIFKFTDGTEIEVPVRYPQDKLNSPGMAWGGGERAPVRDILAGENITVVNNNGIYTISSTGGSGGGVTKLTSNDGSVTLDPASGVGEVDLSVTADSTGLPFYNIPSSETVTVPVNRQHLTVGDVSVEGEFIVEGEQVVL